MNVQLQEKHPSKLAAEHKTTLGKHLSEFWHQGMFLSLFCLVRVNRGIPIAGLQEADPD